MIHQAQTQKKMPLAKVAEAIQEKLKAANEITNKTYVCTVPAKTYGLTPLEEEALEVLKLGLDPRVINNFGFRNKALEKARAFYNKLMDKKNSAHSSTNTDNK